MRGSSFETGVIESMRPHGKKLLYLFGLAAIGACLFATTALAAGPANNNFSAAQTISGASGSTTGTNVGANKEPGEPNHAGNKGGASVWYSWTAPQTGPVTISTFGSSFDTLLGVYTGSSVSSLTTIASNDDDSTGAQSSLTRLAMALSVTETELIPKILAK